MDNDAPRSKPDLYAYVSAPYPTAAAAQVAMKEFLDGLAALREKHRIPEVVVVVGAHFYADDETKMTMETMTLGNTLVHAPVLGALAFRTFTRPLCDTVDRLRKLAMEE